MKQYLIAVADGDCNIKNRKRPRLRAACSFQYSRSYAEYRACRSIAGVPKALCTTRFFLKNIVFLRGFQQLEEVGREHEQVKVLTAAKFHKVK